MRRLPHGVTVQWKHRGDGELSPRGNPTETWTGPVPIQGCGIAPMTPTEQEALKRDPAQAPQMILTDDPVAAGVTYRDRIILSGQAEEYEVIGDAESWSNPYTGRQAGYRIYINLWKG